jgi:hypothetical protein
MAKDFMFETVKDGNWSDRSIWKGGFVPTYASGSILIRHRVEVDNNCTLLPTTILVAEIKPAQPEPDKTWHDRDSLL